MVKRTRILKTPVTRREHIRVLKAYARHHTTALQWIGKELKKAGIFIEHTIGALAKAVLRGLASTATRFITEG